MYWQKFGEFLVSYEIIPAYFALGLTIFSPLFSLFIRLSIEHNISNNLRDNVKDVVGYATDAVSKVSLITSLFIACVNYIVMVSKGGIGEAYIYPAIVILFLILISFLSLPYISPGHLTKTYYGLYGSTWFWLVAIVINLIMTHILYDDFRTKP